MFLQNLANLPIEVEPNSDMAEFFAAYHDLMDQHRLTVYDAAYSELALRKQLPIATFDGALIVACKALGHPLL